MIEWNMPVWPFIRGLTLFVQCLECNPKPRSKENVLARNYWREGKITPQILQRVGLLFFGYRIFDSVLLDGFKHGAADFVAIASAAVSRTVPPMRPDMFFV